MDLKDSGDELMPTKCPHSSHPSAGQDKLVWTLCKKTFIYSITIRTKIPRKDVLDVVHMLGGIIWNAMMQYFVYSSSY